LYASPNIIRVIKSKRMRRERHVARMRETNNVNKIFVRKPEGKRPSGRPRRRWEDNIVMILEKYGGDVWTGFRWLRTGTGGRLL
jgi:hypothetical protein